MRFHCCNTALAMLINIDQYCCNTAPAMLTSIDSCDSVLLPHEPLSCKALAVRGRSSPEGI